MSGELATQSPAWLDELIEATLAWIAECLGIPPVLLTANFDAGFTDVDTVSFAEAWGLLGIEAQEQPTYRTEPIEGAELGGQPRNPEADVIDEIDRLVDWQIEKGKGL